MKIIVSICFFLFLLGSCTSPGTYMDRIDELESEISSLRSANDDLEYQVSELNDEIEYLKSEIEELQSAVEDLRGELSEIMDVVGYY